MHILHIKYTEAKKSSQEKFCPEDVQYSSLPTLSKDVLSSMPDVELHEISLHEANMHKYAQICNRNMHQICKNMKTYGAENMQ